MKNRLFALLAAICLVSSLSVSAFAAEESHFSDVDRNAPYAEAIRWASELGYINGYPDGRFGPNDSVTRAQLAAIFYRAAGSPNTSGTTRFSDVQSNAYYVNAAIWTEENGLITGYPDGRFGVDDPVTRQQVAAILWRWAGSPDASAADYTDGDMISSYAQAAVGWSRANGIMDGRTDGRFAPNDNATRGEVVSALYQYRNLPTSEPDDTEEDSSMPQLIIEVGDQTFTATLLDNPTTRGLMERLPMTINMSEMNGNEKYYFMPESLPTDSYRPGNIHAGDLMLYGSDCLVLFYESFSSNYSYTRLGNVDDPSGLATALGRGNVSVAFRIA